MAHDDKVDLNYKDHQSLVRQSDDTYARQIIPIRDVAPTAIGDGAVTALTPGTPVQLPSIPCSRVFIQAWEDNADMIVVGSSTVVAAKATRSGRSLAATQGDWFRVKANANELYVDAVNAADKFHFHYE